MRPFLLLLVGAVCFVANRYVFPEKPWYVVPFLCVICFCLGAATQAVTDNRLPPRKTEAREMESHKRKRDQR